MSIKEYLESLQGEVSGEEGSFTISTERAEELLAEHMLSDVWQGWLCLIQGLIRQGTRRLKVDTSTSTVSFETSFPREMSIRSLLDDERLLLGWLNLRWFGSLEWDPLRGLLELQFSGSAWRRYKLGRTIKSFLSKHLRYLGIPLTLNGRSLPGGELPEAPKYSFYHPHPEDRQSLRFPGALRVEPGTKARFFRLGEERSRVPQQWPPDDDFAAIAYRTSSSWSQVQWVHHGVIIQEERNTLERPGLSVLASVDSLGLSTDLAGFAVVANDPYFKFVRQLKKDVLWML